jgi:hypothetical protein
LQLELDYSSNLKVTDNGIGRRYRTDGVLNDNYFGKAFDNDLERWKNILKYS